MFISKFFSTWWLWNECELTVDLHQKNFNKIIFVDTQIFIYLFVLVTPNLFHFYSSWIYCLLLQKLKSQIMRSLFAYLQKIVSSSSSSSSSASASLSPSSSLSSASVVMSSSLSHFDKLKHRKAKNNYFGSNSTISRGLAIFDFMGSGCSTAVEPKPHDPEVVGLIKCWAFLL